MTITWYSTNKKLAAVDHDAIGKEEALRIVDGYFARLRPHYEWVEEAIAETTFGFQKSKSEFIEISLNSTTNISFRYEVKSPRKILFLRVPKLFQKVRTLYSKGAVGAEVAAFFDLDSAAYREHVASS